MDYFKYSFTSRTVSNDILIAFLSELPFDTFEETETGFDAYLPAAAETPGVRESLAKLQQRFDFSFEKERIAGQNWNLIWESNFHPVVVDDFCGVRATFHEPLRGVQHELVIQPKMAFGTGHHETTWMVMQWMRDILFAGKTVFDYGCGTGILAILASMLEAASVDALDIEEESRLNTLENSATNGVTNVAAYRGVLADMPARRYDVILANINRNVILEGLPALSAMVQPQGVLVVSGFISADEALMRKALAEAGFSHIEKKERNNWLALRCIQDQSSAE